MLCLRQDNISNSSGEQLAYSKKARNNDKLTSLQSLPEQNVLLTCNGRIDYHIWSTLSPLVYHSCKIYLTIFKLETTGRKSELL